MARTTRTRLILFGLWLLLYGSFTLFQPALLDDADSVHAEVAREMLVRHDAVTLYANGIRYLEKAPLFYWAMAASFKLFGVSTAASRVPLALGVLLLALLLESFSRRAFHDETAGLFAGLITLSSFGVFIFSRINLPDVLVCGWLSLALTCFWRTEAQPRPTRWLCWGFAAACALDVLTKGLIGIVFPLGIAGITLLATRGPRGTWRRIKALHPLSSASVFLLIAAPWHLLAALANPTVGAPGGLRWTGGHLTVPLPTDGNVHGWAWFYFVNEQLLRYLNLRVPRDYDTVPLWLFLGLILVWLLPWSALLPQALARAMPLGQAAFRRRLRAFSLPPQERTHLLLLVWAVLPLAFFCFSTRQEYYVLPSLPPLILLIAADLACPPAGTRQPWAARAMLAAGAAATAASVFFLLHAQAPPPDTDLATLLDANPADYALSFGHFLDLNARSLGLFRLCLWLTATVPLGGAAAFLLLMRRNRVQAATLALAAAGFVFLFASWKALGIFSPTLSSAQLARRIQPELRPGDLIAIHGEYEAGSTLGFLLSRSDLHLVEGRSSNLWYGSFFPDAPGLFESRESLAAAWAGPQRIFLWQDPADRDRPPLVLPGPVYLLLRSGGKEILSNRPGTRTSPAGRFP